MSKLDLERNEAVVDVDYVSVRCGERPLLLVGNGGLLVTRLSPLTKGNHH